MKKKKKNGEKLYMLCKCKCECVCVEAVHICYISARCTEIKRIEKKCTKLSNES